MLKLEIDHLIGSGWSRFTFQHPDDWTRCIKIDHEDNLRPETPREVAYYQRLKRARGQSSFQSIVNFHGIVATNLGRGGVFELVRNETDGQQSKNLFDFVQSHGLTRTRTRLRDALTQLNRLMLEEAVTVIDAHPRNFCVRELSNGQLQLVAVDGMGHRDYFPLCEYWPWFGRRKIHRYAERFSLTSLEDLLAREPQNYVAKVKKLPQQLMAAA